MIVLDLDGVGADFTTAACEVHGRAGFEVTRWNFFDTWMVWNNLRDHRDGFHLMTPAEFWKPIHALGDEFYADIVQPYPWLDELMGIIKGAGDFVIMSSPSDSPVGYAGKKIWCDKYLGRGFKLIVGSEKRLLSQPGRVLIDDYEENIRNFVGVKNPGQAITFPQLWNSRFDRVDDRLCYLKYKLDQWSRCTYV